MPTADPEVTGGRLVRTREGYAGLYFAPSDPEAPTLVYFHGNADQLGNGPAYFGRHMRDRFGLGFFGVEYPGFGVAEGSISEESMIRSGEALIRHLREELGVENDRIVVLGQSIGCVPALALSASGVGSKTVLVSPFTSLHAVALSAYPLLLRPVSMVLRAMLFDTCDNLSTAARVRSPTLVFHGDRDEIVPFAHGNDVARALPNAEFVRVPRRGHNDIFDGSGVFSRIASFANGERQKSSTNKRA